MKYRNERKEFFQGNVCLDYCIGKYIAYNQRQTGRRNTLNEGVLKGIPHYGRGQDSP